MEQGPIDRLLEPSLAPDASGDALAPYSVRASFFVAFFGGVFALLIFSALSSRRMRRLERDAALYVALAIASASLVVLEASWLAAGTVPAWLEILGEGTRGVRNLSRVLALAAFGAVALRHRTLQKAIELSGREAPNPWSAGLASSFVGGLITLALAAPAYIAERGAP